MTHDILAYDPSLAVDLAGSRRIYSETLEFRQFDGDVTPQARLFYAALLDYYPVLDVRRTDEFRSLLRTPFEWALLPVGIWFGFSADATDEMMLVSRLANECGLAVYDPQADLVEPPFPALDLSREWAPSDPDCGSVRAPLSA